MLSEYIPTFSDWQLRILHSTIKFSAIHFNLNAYLVRCKAFGYSWWAFRSMFHSLQSFCSFIALSFPQKLRQGARPSPGSTVISSLVLHNEIIQDCVSVSSGGSVLVYLTVTPCPDQVWLYKATHNKSCLFLIHLSIWTSKQYPGISAHSFWSAPHSSALHLKYLLIAWNCTSFMYSTNVIFPKCLRNCEPSLRDHLLCWAQNRMSLVPVRIFLLHL